MRRQPRLAKQLSGSTVQHLELRIPREHDLDSAVAVEVVNLEGLSLVSSPFLGFGAALLPQHPAIERDGRQATDVIERISSHLRHVLREEHVEPPVAVEVAEPHVAARAVSGRVELLPQRRLRVLRAQARQLVAALLDPLPKVGLSRRACRHAKRLEPRRHVGGEAGNACVEGAVTDVEDLLAVHRRAQPVGLDRDLEPIPASSCRK